MKEKKKEKHSKFDKFKFDLWCQVEINIQFFFSLFLNFYELEGRMMETKIKPKMLMIQ